MAEDAGPAVLREGAVAVIDALGFKGIWNQVRDPASIIAKLEALRGRAESLEQWLPARGPFPPVRMSPVRSRFFSDGIVITAVVSPEEGLHSVGAVVEAVAHAVLTVIGLASKPLGEAPPMLYRGCISVGPILAKGDFFVGKAIDDAAQWSQEADAALVWLLPSAARALGPSPPENLVFEWDVPLKRHSSPLRALVVNPLGRGSPEHWEKIMDDADDDFMRAFGAELSLDVEIKKQNTRRAFDAARMATRRWFTEKF